MVNAPLCALSTIFPIFRLIPFSVVERAHHHVLKTRIANYEPEMLNELQVKDRKLFEYWAHAAAYLPIEDYRYYLPIMEAVP